MLMERLQGSAGPAQLSLLAGSSRRLLREGSALFNGLGIHGAGGQSPASVATGLICYWMFLWHMSFHGSTQHGSLAPVGSIQIKEDPSGKKYSSPIEPVFGRSFSLLTDPLIRAATQKEAGMPMRISRK